MNATDSCVLKIYRREIDVQSLVCYNLTQLANLEECTMATREQIETVAAVLQQIHPAPFFHKINQSQAGIGAVMRYLSETEGDVTAGSIADFMGVSTARVAVLLKKMAAKGLIVKAKNTADGRVTIVRLSDAGKQAAQSMQNSFYSRVGKVIDKIGMERMLEFLATAAEISQINPDPPAEFE